MTEKMVENRINKMEKLESEIEALQKQVDAIKTELKNDMQEKGLEEMETKNFVIRWKEIVSSHLDGKALKAALPEIYSQYCKSSTTRRFTIA